MTDTSDTDGDEEATTGGGDEDLEQAREAPAGQEEKAGKGGEPSQPQQLLDALGEEIDTVRRRVVEQDPAAREDEQFIQEGEADEDEPVDDTTAPG